MNPFRNFSRKHRTLYLVLVVSLLFHLALGIGAGCWIVARAWIRPPVAIALNVAARPAGLPPAEEDGAAGGIPSLPEMPSAAPVPPPLPALAAPVLAAADPAPTGAPGAGRSGAGMGAGAGVGSGAGLGLSLFGTAEEGGRAVIALDISESMFMREDGAFARMAAEALRAVDALGAGGSFDLIIFSDGSLAWQRELVPATAENRRAAHAWLEKAVAQGRTFNVRAYPGVVWFEGSGSRGDTMLKQAFSLRPDHLVVLTDGQWDVQSLTGPSTDLGAAELAALTDRLQAERGSAPLPIDVFCLRTARSREPELAAMRSLAARSGGQFLPIDGATLTRGEP